jgi:hypothetical protein
MMEMALSTALGVGLAAATGFRLFLPMLVASVAARFGYLPLSGGFEWLGSPETMTIFGVAALAEILAYYVPVVDNLLDTLATPAAVVAGTLLSAAVMVDLPPFVKWAAAIIAGGGAAGLTQGITALVRAHSTVLTGGLGNAVVSSVEIAGALLVSLLAIAAPMLAVAALLVCAWLALRLVKRGIGRGTPPPGAPSA